MKPGEAAIGLRPHSGWAALVTLGLDADGLQLIDRRRIELVDADAAWARQPYHAARGLRRAEAANTISRGTQAARRHASRALHAALRRAQRLGHRVEACAVIGGAPMPDWTLEEILAVHVRMHKAEGVLFCDALVHAARVSGVGPIVIPERELPTHVQRALGVPVVQVLGKLAPVGRAAGAPWGRDQKDASLAALVALGTRLTPS